MRIKKKMIFKVLIAQALVCAATLSHGSFSKSTVLAETRNKEKEQQLVEQNNLNQDEVDKSEKFKLEKDEFSLEEKQLLKVLRDLKGLKLEETEIKDVIVRLKEEGIEGIRSEDFKKLISVEDLDKLRDIIRVLDIEDFKVWISKLDKISVSLANEKNILRGTTSFGEEDNKNEGEADKTDSSVLNLPCCAEFETPKGTEIKITPLEQGGNNLIIPQNIVNIGEKIPDKDWEEIEVYTKDGKTFIKKNGEAYIPMFIPSPGMPTCYHRKENYEFSSNGILVLKFYKDTKVKKLNISGEGYQGRIFIDKPSGVEINDIHIEGNNISILNEGENLENEIVKFKNSIYTNDEARAFLVQVSKQQWNEEGNFGKVEVIATGGKVKVNSEKKVDDYFFDFPTETILVREQNYESSQNGIINLVFDKSNPTDAINIYENGCNGPIALVLKNGANVKNIDASGNKVTIFVEGEEIEGVVKGKISISSEVKVICNANDNKLKEWEKEYKRTELARPLTYRETENGGRINTGSVAGLFKMECSSWLYGKKEFIVNVMPLIHVKPPQVQKGHWTPIVVNGPSGCDIKLVDVRNKSDLILRKFNGKLYLATTREPEKVITIPNTFVLNVDCHEGITQEIKIPVDVQVLPGNMKLFHIPDSTEKINVREENGKYTIEQYKTVMVPIRERGIGGHKYCQQIKDTDIIDSSTPVIINIEHDESCPVGKKDKKIEVLIDVLSGKGNNNIFVNFESNTNISNLSAKGNASLIYDIGAKIESKSILGAKEFNRNCYGMEEYVSAINLRENIASDDSITNVIKLPIEVLYNVLFFEPAGRIHAKALGLKDNGSAEELGSIYANTMTAPAFEATEFLAMWGLADLAIRPAISLANRGISAFAATKIGQRILGFEAINGVITIGSKVKSVANYPIEIPLMKLAQKCKVGFRQLEIPIIKLSQKLKVGFSQLLKKTEMNFFKKFIHRPYTSVNKLRQAFNNYLDNIFINNKINPAFAFAGKNSLHKNIFRAGEEGSKCCQYRRGILGKVIDRFKNIFTKRKEMRIDFSKIKPTTYLPEYRDPGPGKDFLYKHNRRGILGKVIDRFKNIFTKRKEIRIDFSKIESTTYPCERKGQGHGKPDSYWIDIAIWGPVIVITIALIVYWVPKDELTNAEVIHKRGSSGPEKLGDRTEKFAGQELYNKNKATPKPVTNKILEVKQYKYCYDYTKNSTKYATFPNVGTPPEGKDCTRVTNASDKPSTGIEELADDYSQNGNEFSVKEYEGEKYSTCYKVTKSNIDATCKFIGEWFNYNNKDKGKDDQAEEKFEESGLKNFLTEILKESKDDKFYLVITSVQLERYTNHSFIVLAFKELPDLENGYNVGFTYGFYENGKAKTAAAEFKITKIPLIKINS